MKKKEKRDILYDCALWLFNIMLDIFFREIRPRGSHKIPKEGPLIFVAAPHANQVNMKAFFKPTFLPHNVGTSLLIL
jgi:1-acyl-sn-glycerol-3-phosphate acyltransferase